MVKSDVEFWNAVENHRLEIPHCCECGRYFFYPRPFCPHCWSKNIERRQVSGSGSIWSYAIVRFPVGGNAMWKDRLPFVVVLVELDEGVRMMSNIIDFPPEEIHSGQRVEVCFHKLGDRTLHAFRPIDVVSGEALGLDRTHS